MRPAFSRGYEASRLGRRLRGWEAERRTIDSLLIAGGQELRARARQLVRENAYASNATDAYEAAVAGTGIKPSPLVEDPELKAAIQKLWLTWTDEADADGLTDFYGLQALAARAVFEAGEVFIRFRPRRIEDGLAVPLQLQLLESEMLPYWKNETGKSGNVIREGIEFDPIGRRVAYHFYRNHPGEAFPLVTNTELTVVPAAEVLHLYKPLRPGQMRGQPGLTPAMVRLYLLDLYDDAELDRKRVSAMFAGFISKKTPASPIPVVTEDAVPAGADDPGPGGAIAPLEPGTLQVLEENEEITFSSPSEVGGSYEAFMWRNLLAIAAGLGVPYTAVTGDFSKANYSSERAAQVEFRRRVDQFQHAVMVFQMCRPVYARWFGTAVLAGALPVGAARFAAENKSLVAAKWMPSAWEWVDPLKDGQAKKLAISEGWTSRDDVIEAGGEDPEAMDRRIAASRKRERDMKLGFRPLAERVNVNISAEAATVEEALDAVDDRGDEPAS